MTKKMYRFVRLLLLVAIVFTSLVFSRISSSQQTSSIATKAFENATAQNVQYAEDGIVGAWYLSFPLSGQSSMGATINSIFDHSRAGSYSDNDETVAYTGEKGESQFGRDPVWGTHDGFKNAANTDFIVNGHYAGGGSARYLYYDGHPGYDYRAAETTQLYAPADGTIVEVEGSTNTFYIDHGNGYRSYFLHTGTRNANNTWSRNNVTGTVKRGDTIAKVGGAGGFPPHLHYELARKVGNDWVPVDPYGWSGGCDDPYAAAVSTNLWTNSGTQWNFDTPGNYQGWLPFNIECFSVHDGGFYINPDANDPFIQSPPLVNVNASSFDTIEVRIASNAPDGSGAIYFTTTSSPDWNENKKVDFFVNNDGSWNTIAISMRNNSLWTGQITGIRIDPSNSGRANFSSDTIAFDYLRLVSGNGTTQPSYQGFHEYVDCNNIGGWVWDANNAGTRLGVVVYDDLNGALVASGTADQLRQDLVNAGKGDGRYGFTIAMPAGLKDGQNHSLRVKVVNTNFSLGNTPKSFNSANSCAPPPSTPSYEGYHDWVNCDFIAGWVRDLNNASNRLGVSVYDDASGALVASGTADQLRQDLVNAGKGDGRYGFTIAMPARLKDGQNHNLRVKVLNTNFSLGNTPKSFNSANSCAPPPSTPSYEGYHDWVNCDFIAGWVRDLNNASNRLRVSVYDDATGALVASGTADQLRQDLVNAGKGDGRYGFAIAMPAGLKDGQNHSLRVKVVNTNFSLGNTPKSFNSATSCPPPPSTPSYEGYHDWVNCDFIAGWVRDLNNASNRLGVAVYDDASGALVASGTADQLRQDLVNAGKGDGRYGFTIAMPAGLKDGQNHSLRVKVVNTNFSLGNTPKSFNSASSCAPPPPSGLPDLVVSALSGPSSVTAGGQMSVSATLLNQGNAAATSSRLGFYFSTDNTISTSDSLVGSCNMAGLSAGTSQTCSGTVPVPQFSPGTYYLGAIADDQSGVAESNEGNNTRSAGAITVNSTAQTIAWEFNTLGNFEGWSVLNASSSAVHDGILFIDPSGSDPNIVGPNVSASASSYRTVIVRLASNSLDSFGNIYFKTQSENFYSADKRVEFSVQNCSLCGNASFVTYTINMTSNSKWAGTITGIRIDPANDGKAGTNADSIGFDFVRLTP